MTGRIVWDSAAFFLLILLSSTVFGRGGGGCFLPRTLVSTPAGAVPIEDIVPGDAILSFDASGGRIVDVVAVYETGAVRYYEVVCYDAAFNLTGEQLVYIGPGVLVEAKNLKVGDELQVYLGGSLKACKILSIRIHDEETQVYNLLAGGTNTYIANSILVHNKGCFLPDTPILMSDGSWKSIGAIQAGDTVKAFTYDGTVVNATVYKVYKTTTEGYYVIAAGDYSVSVTAEHPFYAVDGTFRTVEALQPGDTIYVFDGGGITARKISSKEWVKKNVTVYNLQTEWPNTFFAGYLAVHNKGCFLPDTPVLTASGSWKNISDVKAGDVLTAFTPEGRLVNATVHEVYTASSTEHYRITAGDYVISVTAEHPFYVGEGTFRTAESLGPGDTIYVFNGSGISNQAIGSKEKVSEDIIVYNLRTEWPNTFFASYAAVHNKGGCFAAGTRILTPEGERNIESLEAGDGIVSVTASGGKSVSSIQKTFKTRTELIRIKTASRSVKTSAEHPFLALDGIFKPVRELKEGDSVAVWDNGRVEYEKIEAIESLGEAEAYNLEVGEPHTFIADGFVVHNKGGGIGGSFSGGSNLYSYKRSDLKSSDPAVLFLVFGIYFLVAVILKSVGNRNNAQDLDYRYPRGKIEEKAAKTAKVLDYLKQRDKAWDRDALLATARATFTKLQDCWWKRDYEPMKPLLMTDLYNQHLAQINSMKRNHEINVLEGIRIDYADIINVRYYNKKNMQEFTVLFEATVRDYYVDDRTQEFLRGDCKPTTFQEFWVFQRQEDAWLLREINQTRESNALKEDDFVEDLTLYQLETIYGELAKTCKDGPEAPWLEKAISNKSGKITRMLNFLKNTDRGWDESYMKALARKIFIDVLNAFEKRDVSGIKEETKPEAFEYYTKSIEKMKEQDITIEYRNMCVRKVDIVLIKNYADNNRDEFTARIKAHAQRIEKHKNSIILQDEYVRPFEEYWVFRKVNNEWKLASVLPEAKVKSTVKEPNVDEESSREQIEWYYTQDRAI